MNKEEFDINQELEQMRQDYAALKERFDKQEIINNHLMDKAFHADARWLFLEKYISPVLAALLIALAIVLGVIKYVPQWIIIAMIAFGVISIIGVLWAYKGVNKEALFNSDIVTATETMRKFKKRYFILEAVTWTYFIGMMAFGALQIASYNFPAHTIVIRELLLALLVISAGLLEYFLVKRQLKARDDIIERLQMREDGD